MLHRRAGPHRAAAAVGELGVTEDRIYLDHGLTGTNRARPGLDQALAALREGDTLVVPKLDRLARSVPDARDIGDGLAARGIKLSLGGQVYDPTDPMGKMFFNILATFAEFEVDLLRMRTREGMAVARAKGRLKGRRPKLSTKQQTEFAPHARHRRLHHHRPSRTVQHLPTHRLPHPRSRGNCCCTTQPPITPRPTLHLLTARPEGTRSAPLPRGPQHLPRAATGKLYRNQIELP